MKKIIIKLISLLDRVTKNLDILLFHSNPDYSDNSYALFKYLVINGYSEKYKLVWLTEGSPKKLKEKIKKEFKIELKVVSKKSIKGIFFYLRAKHVFFTHGLYFNAKSKKNKRINLWHGMPLKKIGKNIQNNLSKKYSKPFMNNNTTIATSEFFKKVMADSFWLRDEEVLVVGQPRNDLLFEKSNYFQKINLETKDFSKIFLWMPTFRKTIDSFYNEGDFEENKIGVLELEKIKEFNEILKEKRVLLLIKIHPLDIIQRIKIENTSNLKIIYPNDLEKLDEQLYPLLGEVDALLTDYSSVWIDFQITNKPVYFVMPDYDAYKNTRGFVFENFQNYSSYKIMKNYNDLIEFIRNIEIIYKIEDKKIENRLNDFFDNKSSERLIKKLKIWGEK